MLKIKYLIFFLFINFGGLSLGNFLMNNGPQSYWYTSLDKAPWTPSGWVFGIAWTIIMICFSIYLVFLFVKKNNTNRRSLYIVQVILNVSWSYVFFNQHQVFIAQVGITLLTALIFYFFFAFLKEQKFLI